MMGFAMYDYHVPIVKTSSAILCLKKDEVTAVERRHALTVVVVSVRVRQDWYRQDWRLIQNMDRKNSL